jgi:MinD superfamily P-loop ATPase
MKIAVASGKGGTGKTTMAVSLALAAEGDVQLLDCDVEEPNAHIFLKGKLKRKREVTILLPEINEDKCDGCDECTNFCQFNAIALIGRVPLIYPEMCHGCGGCKRICPRKAIREIPHRIGEIEVIRKDNILLAQGRLDIGAVLAPTIIRSLKEESGSSGLVILDAPPGTSCPVIETLRESDFVILVTESTPFGLNDLKLAVGAVREMDLPFGVIINRTHTGYNCINNYCRREKINILAEIPEDRKIAEAYAKGVPLIDAMPGYRLVFEKILQQLKTSEAV